MKIYEKPLYSQSLLLFFRAFFNPSDPPDISWKIYIPESINVCLIFIIIYS